MGGAECANSGSRGGGGTRPVRPRSWAKACSAGSPPPPRPRKVCAQRGLHLRGAEARQAAFPALWRGRQFGDLRLCGNRRSAGRSEEHTSELQSLMRISYAVFCLKKKTYNNTTNDIQSRQRLTKQCTFKMITSKRYENWSKKKTENISKQYI